MPIFLFTLGIYILYRGCVYEHATHVHMGIYPDPKELSAVVYTNIRSMWESNPRYIVLQITQLRKLYIYIYII